ncbi:MAG: NlpC/P60 family protein [Bacteroidales bacterium]|nr:NlpC/P60 family protein [Bacteroidales bacterium]
MAIYGFCNIALIPLRSRPSHRSEMISQLLFGEAYEIIKQDINWLYVRSLYDDYKGYLDRNQLSILRDSEIETYYTLQTPLIAQDWTLLYDKRRDFRFYVPPGAGLPLKDDNTIYLGAEWFEIETIAPQKSMHEHIRLFMNAPYLWGGRSPLGIDCSGFNQILFKMAGVKLLRDASQQAQQGNPVESIEAAKCFDVAFFTNKENRITHTGIVYTDHSIVHASSKVRKDRLDNKGIFNIEKEEYSHSLYSIRSII